MQNPNQNTGPQVHSSAISFSHLKKKKKICSLPLHVSHIKDFDPYLKR